MLSRFFHPSDDAASVHAKSLARSLSRRGSEIRLSLDRTLLVNFNLSKPNSPGQLFRAAEVIVVDDLTFCSIVIPAGCDDIGYNIMC